MPQPAVLAPPVLRDAPRKLLWPRLPYVYDFALANAPAHTERIALCEPFSVVVADGTRAPHDPDDWFARRVPAIPPVTGPLQIAGIGPGDTLRVAVLALDAADLMLMPPPMLTVAIAGSRGNGSDSAQVAIPAGGIASMPVLCPGAQLTVGPVLVGPEDGAVDISVAATVTLRCTCVQPQG